MMITILAKQYSQAVSFLCAKLDELGTNYSVNLCKDKISALKYVKEGVSNQGLIVINNVGESSSLFAEAFALPMFYDKYAEKGIFAYCNANNCDIPPQHVLDKLCTAPESFNHITPNFGFQCACVGQCNNCLVYLLPDDSLECGVVFDNCIVKDLFRNAEHVKHLTYKIFGLSKRDVEGKLKDINFVSHSCETTNLDTKLTVTFPSKCSNALYNETVSYLENTFANNIYAKCNQSLEKTVVDLLIKRKLTISTAESITGGLIASTIVSVAGASNVLTEGLVTYSVPSKCKRLDINPHYVDEYGVVSKQVAEKMALGLRNNGCNIAVATTGYAGPQADDGYPVGLCYISVATNDGVSTFQNVFVGDRNSVRQQVCNTALFLVYKKFCKRLTI